MPAPRGRDFERTRERLAEWLRGRLPGASGLAVSSLSGPAATGFSNDTLLFDLTYEVEGRRESLALVCRVEPTGFGIFPTYDVGAQYRIMDALRATDVPVPAMFGMERDPAPLGAPFFVMARVEGRIPSDNPPYHADGWLKDAAPAERAAVWESGVDVLAAIHRCDPAALGIDFLDAPGRDADTVGWQLEHWRRYFDWVADGRAFPALEAGWRWLVAQRPAPSRQRGLCWGDARIGNMIFRGGRCVAVLDWEMATLGPAEMDLGWFLLLDRHHHEAMGVERLDGLPSREATIARWERGTDRRASDVAYWEVFAAWRFGVIMARIAAQMQHYEILPGDSTFAADNTASRLLAKLLEQAPDGPR
jgi:aminoglycoside phosphotransferase (APT) family kinase protein